MDTIGGMLRRWICAWIVSVAVLSGAAAQTATTGADEPPRLIVLVVVDMLRSDYLPRFEPAFGEGGLRRLMEDGAWFVNAAHTHTATSTGPGHAAIATGCLPARAGMPENVWLDADTQKKVYCVADPDARLVGAVPGLPDARVSAAQLERSTLADWMLAAQGPATRIVSVSWKDRSALLLGARAGGDSWFMERNTGTWVTTSALRARLPDWLATLDRRGPVARLAERAWTPALGEAEAAALTGPDLAPGEDDSPPLGASFPRRLPPDDDMRALSGAVAHTPCADELVLQVALGALEHESLGQDRRTDLLAIGFSALDYAGHTWGPDSREVLDVLLGVDRCLARLMQQLDERVGSGRWMLALSSDHGVVPLAEQTGGTAMVDTEFVTAIEAGMTKRYGAPAGGTWLADFYRPSLWLAHAAVEGSGRARADLARGLADVLLTIPGVSHAATHTELQLIASSPTAALSVDPDLRALALDLHPTRSGDVLFLLAPGTSMPRGVKADHGGHHPDDRHVPVLLYGASIQPGVQRAAAAPLDLAPTLAHLARVPAPRDLDGRVLGEALRD